MQQGYNKPHLLNYFSWGLVLTLLFVMPWHTQAQDEIGGPYTADSNTVLLMHFDGDLSNDSDSSADGVAHGSIQYIQNSGLRSELGSAARIENGSPQDSSYITVADTAGLDLDGAWTIELWVNVFTFGNSNDDWRYQPRIVNKPGDPWYQANYWIYLRGGPRNFWTGFREDVGDGSYMEVITPENLVEPGTWFHFAFIRDTTNNLVVQLLHRKNNDGSIERIFFGTTPFDPVTESPPTINDNPLYIGNSHAAGGGFFLDGFIDELRISTTVRNYDMPPVIKSVETLGNQTTGSDYSVSSDILTLGNTNISSATLHYRVNEGSWQQLSMAEDTAGYTASIPAQGQGDIVEYYVEATDNEGRSSLSPANATEDTTFYQFAIWQPETKTLHLSFEEGSGAPVDSSLYGNTVEVLNGEASYSDDAAAGNYSMSLSDSTWLSIDSPFLTSDRSRTELWFKADSIIGGRRLITSSASPWYNTNTQIWFTSTSIKAGGYFPESSAGYVEATLDSGVFANEWYHAIYQVMEDSIMFELRDASDELIQRKFTSHGGTNPVQASQPLAIGNSPVDAHRYSGLVDEVKMYNYPTDTTFTTDIADQPGELPRRVALDQNYPNPFNPTTTISYKLPQATQVTLSVYDMLGRKVRTLVDTRKSAGAHTVQFEANGMASGMYLYRLEAEGVSKTRKMMLMK